MSDLENRLGGIRAGVEKLIKERDEQRAKVAKLSSQMHDENGMLEVLRKRISSLEQENLKLKSEKKFSGADGRGTKEEIDALVKEIDHCLSLLKP